MEGDRTSRGCPDRGIRVAPARLGGVLAAGLGRRRVPDGRWASGEADVGCWPGAGRTVPGEGDGGCRPGAGRVAPGEGGGSYRTGAGRVAWVKVTAAADPAPGA